MSENRDETNKPILEDWTMSALPTVKTETAETQNDGWKMPDPVFRVSDGMPFNNSKSDMPPSKQPAAVNSEQITKTEPVDLNIQPQPFLPEELNTNQIKEKPVEHKSGVPRVIFGIFGILTMALFALAFLIGVYFLFFYKSQE
jgi:hypothetical protein